MERVSYVYRSGMLTYPSTPITCVLCRVIAKAFGVMPLWVCPMRIFPTDSGFVRPTTSGEEMFIDIGMSTIAHENLNEL